VNYIQVKMLAIRIECITVLIFWKVGELYSS